MSLMQQRKSRNIPRRLISLLMPRQATRISTWNTRSLYQTGKTSIIAAEIRRYNLEVLGLCEVWWMQTGKFKVATVETLLYSGHVEHNAAFTEVVALMISKQAQTSLLNWKPISSRLIIACLKTTNGRIKVRIITTHQRMTQTRRLWLQSLLLEQRKNEVTIIMGDLNAKIGLDNKVYESVMGRHGLIGGRFFPHRRIHKASWRSPDNITENENQGQERSGRWH